MRPVLLRQQRADVALREVFEAIIEQAAERAGRALAWAPELAARALLLLINGSVADWLREPGGTSLVTRAVPLVTSFLESLLNKPRR